MKITEKTLLALKYILKDLNQQYLDEILNLDKIKEHV